MRIYQVTKKKFHSKFEYKMIDFYTIKEKLRTLSISKMDTSNGHILKVIFVGEASVGKTSIINQFLNKAFSCIFLFF